MKYTIYIAATIALMACGSNETTKTEWKTMESGKEEVHLSNLKQLTF